MIVRNEEAMLAQCLESVKDADEIIIVDTGSVDKTVDIGEKYTKNIFHFPWIDDFSAARNFAKEKCTGDYILSIDADEVLDAGGIQKIKDFISNYKSKDEAFGVKMKSAINQYFVSRLFKNSKDIFFNGKVHEVLNVLECDRINVGITFGTSLAHQLDPERNLRILEVCIKDHPLNTRYLYYLGREYGYKKEWSNAIEIFERYISLAGWNPEKADAYFMLALCYWNQQLGEKARERALSAISLNANFKAPILLMAEMSFEKNSKQWKKMAETATNEDVLFVRNNYLII